MGAELSTLGMASRWTGVGELIYPYLAAEETPGPGPLERIAARRQALAATGDARAAAAIARLSAAAEATAPVDGETAGAESAVLSESGGGVQTLTTGGACDFWYLYDANGNVGQLLRYDAAGGTVNLAAAYEYDPYGNTLAARDVDGSGIVTANKYRFSTKRLVDYTTPGQGGAVGTTGLYYYGYRFYSPGLGRWISRDPIEEEGGLNLLSMVGNCPSGYVDFLGLSNGCPAGWEVVGEDVPDIIDSDWKLHRSGLSAGWISTTTDYYRRVRGSWAQVGPPVFARCGEGLDDEIELSHSVTSGWEFNLQFKLDFDKIEVGPGGKVAESTTQGHKTKFRFKHDGISCHELVGLVVDIWWTIEEKYYRTASAAPGGWWSKVSAIQSGWLHAPRKIICKRPCGPIHLQYKE